MKSGEFAERVYEIVAQIPPGRVTTYGRISRALGKPRGARMVGWALHGVGERRDLPCQRVVNHAGELSGGWAFGHPDVMRSLLVEEGVPFAAEYTVDLEKCVWDPIPIAFSNEIEDGIGWQQRSTTADEMDNLDNIARGEAP